MRRAVLLLSPLMAVSALAQDPVDLVPLKNWLSLQKNLRSVEADFVQSRSLRTLRKPITSPGKLWFTANGELHWELGIPPKTVFLRNKEGAFLIQPVKKRFQTLAVGTGAPGATQGFQMPEFPLAADLGEFTKRFEVLKIEPHPEHCDAEVLPRDAQAKKYVQVLRLRFDPKNGQLHFFEVVGKDGSSLKTEFSNVRLNQKIDPSVFTFDLNGYRSDSEKH